MLTRTLPLPKNTFLLLGSRGTGKSTLLRHWFPDALWFDLLDQQELFNVMRSPSYFAKAVEAGVKKGEWVVIDEIQKAPHLLDEVHRLLETKGIRFALSGSSARKLKRGGANLLAGRAFVYHLYPLTLAEIGSASVLNELLAFGSLPKVFFEASQANRIERLNAYVSTYISEEIKAEALSRNLPSFSRFLTIAALANGQVTNVSNIARDAGVSRTTVASYFTVLEDTLVGSFLPAWLPRLRIKEVNHPKFYLFDTGVTRALTERLGNVIAPEEKGVLVETLAFHELKCALEYHRVGGSLSYWRTHDGVEVDFVWQKGERTLAIEVKSSDSWKGSFGKGLMTFQELNRKKTICIGVYLGTKRLKEKFGVVYPFAEFAALLQNGNFFSD